MLLQNWGNFFLLQIRASVITKLGQFHFITNWGKFYYKLGKLFLIINWGMCYYKLGQLNYYKSGQLLQIRVTVITNWGSDYKLGQTLLQIRATITN